MKIRMCRIVKIGATSFTLLLALFAAVAMGESTPPKNADAVVMMKSKGVSCGSCAGKIEKALMEKPGVAAVEVDVDNGRVTAAYDSGAIKPEVIADTVTGQGYVTTVVKAMSLDEFRATAGKGDASQNAGRGGCGGGCCDKNRKAN